jgi:mono/diheme cytochrome c family protein
MVTFGIQVILSLRRAASICIAGVLVTSIAAAQESGSRVSQQALLQKYCITCHNEKLKTGGLTLRTEDLADVPAHAETWEKVIRKLSVGAMPPQGMPHPGEADLAGLTSYLETALGQSAREHIYVGRALPHRLNRSEYHNAIRDLLGLDVDVSSLLPADDASYGFDNIADVLKISPLLLDRYMSASWNISRLAVGDTSVGPSTATYKARPDLSQNYHVEGLPDGTRGGISFHHNFPLDGEYTIQVRLWRTIGDAIRGLEEETQLEVTIDGARVYKAQFGGQADRDLMFRNSGESTDKIDNLLTFRIPVKAGPRAVAVAFIQRSEALDDHLREPFERTTVDPFDYTGPAAVDRVMVRGPFHPTGPGDTPSRRQIFTCRPGRASEEVPCARGILSRLVQRAYRRPATEEDLEDLLSLYQRGRNKGTFESGIELALRRILASPDFLFRMEGDPPGLAEGAVHKLTDLELASRLSFFLWSSIPDEQLLTLAARGELSDPRVYQQQVRRMLADSRSEALVSNFAGQWLYLRNLKNIVPSIDQFPDFDDNLRQAMQRETELFFASIMREDRSVLDFLKADYTFLNERLARHYGIPNIYGTDFQRVTITNPTRRGLLGQASILTVTSQANRTSPVLRGKYILTNILGTPPPPPPPNVPALSEDKDTARPLSLRERMEQHRANPACAGCHKTMDPLGFTLENFDAIGRWRNTDDGARIDPSGTVFNGDHVDGPAALNEMLLRRPEIFVGVLTEKLMTYALGRGVDYLDMPEVRNIVQTAAQSDYRFSAIILGVANSPEFRMKTKPPAENGILAATK